VDEVLRANRGALVSALRASVDALVGRAPAEHAGAAPPASNASLNRWQVRIPSSHSSWR
jgi:hypothetical protein